MVVSTWSLLERPAALQGGDTSMAVLWVHPGLLYGRLTVGGSRFSDVRELLPTVRFTCCVPNGLLGCDDNP